MNFRTSFFLATMCLLRAATGQEMQADIYSFVWNDKGQSGDVVLTVTPGYVRVDQAMRKFAAISEVDTGLITGLEIRDGTWWRFSWPEIRQRVGSSVQPAERLRDLSIPGMASIDLERPLARQFVEEDQGPQFIWRPTDKHRTIAGRDCVQWLGESTEGEDLEVWVTKGDTADLQNAVAALETIAEPLDMVIMRPALPRQFLTAIDSLAKAQVVPMETAWGPRGARSRVVYKSHENRGVDPDRLFLPPSGYRKVDLDAIEMLMATGDEEEEAEKEPERPLNEIPFPTPKQVFPF